MAISKVSASGIFGAPLNPTSIFNLNHNHFFQSLTPSTSNDSLSKVDIDNLTLKLNTPCTPKEMKQRREMLKKVLNDPKILVKFRSVYEIGDLLGDGAFGFVFSVLRKEDSKEFAAKFIMSNKLPSESWVNHNGENVPAEVFALSALNHPNIIKYENHYVDQEFVILITELHGCSWNPTNPKLDFVKNPGLKFKYRPKQATARSGQSLGYRTSSDLFECIDARI